MNILDALKSEPTETEREVYDKIYRFYRGISKNFLQEVSERDDLIQETMIAVIKSSGREYDESKSSVYTYLATLMRNKSIDLWKKKKRRVITKPLRTEPGSNEQIEKTYQEKEEELEDVKRKVPGASKETVELFYLRGLKIEQIQEILNLPEGTVKCHLHRARTRALELMTS